MKKAAHGILDGFRERRNLYGMIMSLSLVPGTKHSNLIVPVDDRAIFFCQMGLYALTAVFPSIFQVRICSAAVLQNIKRTIAKQTIEVIRIRICMAWEIFALPIAEKSIMLSSPVFVHSASS